MLHPMDLLTAAIALVNNAQVVTRSIKLFFV
jgi:predicted nucleic acid-binding protein